MEMDFAVHHCWWKILKSYEEFQKVVIEDGIYKVKKQKNCDASSDEFGRNCKRCNDESEIFRRWFTLG